MSDNQVNSEESILTTAVGQFSNLLPLMLLVYVTLLLGLIVLVNVYFVADIPLRIFFIDPVAEFNAPMYVGLISNLGVLLWCASASICLYLIRTCFQKTLSTTWND